MKCEAIISRSEWRRSCTVLGEVSGESPVTYSTKKTLQTANSWWYNNSSANGDIYGRLYTWNAALNACPDGWHLPTDAEWTTLTNYLGGESVAGGKMKSVTGWNSPNTGATNESGFSALPGGYRIDYDGAFDDAGYGGYWWSATELSGTNAWISDLNYDNAVVYPGSGSKSYGFSVRCV